MYFFEVDVPNSVVGLDWTLIFDIYVVRRGSKNGYHKGV